MSNKDCMYYKNTYGLLQANIKFLNNGVLKPESGCFVQAFPSDNSITFLPNRNRDKYNENPDDELLIVINADDIKFDKPQVKFGD